VHSYEFTRHREWPAFTHPLSPLLPTFFFNFILKTQTLKHKIIKNRVIIKYVQIKSLTQSSVVTNHVYQNHLHNKQQIQWMFSERASGGVVSMLISNAGEPGSSPGGSKDIFSRMRRPITWGW
jgi:hypothetical protein